jgi:phage terminase small subunit
MKQHSSLPTKRALFVKEYLVDLNGTQAAIRAGYKAKNADVQAAQLLGNLSVQEAIAQGQAKRAEKLEIDAEWVVARLRRLADFDARKLFNADGSPKPIHKLDDDTAYAIEGLDVEDLYEHFGKGQAKKIGSIKKYRTAKHRDALELLGRHIAMFTDKIKLEGDLLAEVAERMRAAVKRTGESKR